MDRELGNGKRLRKWKENEETEREWGNGKRMRKWKEDEEMEWEWGNGKRMRTRKEDEKMEREWGNGKRGNGNKMRKLRGNGERMRKWDILSTFPHFQAEKKNDISTTSSHISLAKIDRST